MSKLKILAKYNAKSLEADSCSVCSVKQVFAKFAKFTRKHLYQSLRPATLLKKRLWHRCFSVNFVKFLKTRFYRIPPVGAFESFHVCKLSQICKAWSHLRSSSQNDWIRIANNLSTFLKMWKGKISLDFLFVGLMSYLDFT